MEEPYEISEDEREQIEKYAANMQLKDLSRFSDIQVYMAFVEEQNLQWKEGNVPLAHLLFDFVTMTADADPVDTDYWIIKIDYASAIADIVRKAVAK